MLQLGGELYVRKASVEYHASASFDDWLDVALQCGRIGNSSMVFSGAIFRGSKLLVTCELVYVFADPVSQTSRPVPQVLRTLVGRYEAGEAVLDFKVGDWAALGQDAAKVRAAGFLQAQAIMSGNGRDGGDGTALYAVAYNALGQAIATGRLLGALDGSAWIGQMEVHRALRGAHVGQGILKTLVDAARQRGHAEVLLHAPCSAQDFYQRQGFEARGAPFKEAGIAHVKMARRL